MPEGVPVIQQGTSRVLAGVTYETPMLIVPGVVSGAAYAIGDTVGAQFDVPLPGGATSGVIAKVTIMDRDKEALALDLEVFSQAVTQVADNAAYTISDADHVYHLGTIRFSAGDFASYATEAAACKTSGGNLPFPFAAPSGRLTFQMVTQGVPNFTAATDMGVRFTLLLDP